MLLQRVRAGATCSYNGGCGGGKLQRPARALTQVRAGARVVERWGCSARALLQQVHAGGKGVERCGVLHVLSYNRCAQGPEWWNAGGVLHVLSYNRYAQGPRGRKATAPSTCSLTQVHAGARVVESCGVPFLSR
ncbi:hypothetical protein NDU88_006045 [Pleurodeles waltl]|uniref:Uncharacterized protein n=1 Tax=Pleurodeles waltl TaxID=8319 RepID=A0AAV7L2M7_PLEWA|nr:hypothetical protein NDU88_006045 [Pleurodeles waltl]